MPVPRDFADFCCELLSTLGRVQARRMFGGWGLSVEGLTVAIAADLGGGDTLWLKADAETLARFEAAGCRRFSYPMRRGTTTVVQTMNYYSAPDAAMDDANGMAPWARLALEAAVAARAVPARPAKPKPKQKPKPAQPPGRSRPGRRNDQG